MGCTLFFYHFALFLFFLFLCVFAFIIHIRPQRGDGYLLGKFLYRLALTARTATDGGSSCLFRSSRSISCGPRRPIRVTYYGTGSLPKMKLTTDQINSLFVFDVLFPLSSSRVVSIPFAQNPLYNRNEQTIKSKPQGVFVRSVIHMITRPWVAHSLVFA